MVSSSMYGMEQYIPTLDLTSSLVSLLLRMAGWRMKLSCVLISPLARFFVVAYV